MRKYLALAAAVLAISYAPAKAAYVVNIDQVGSNVVATGSGTFDLSVLTNETPGCTNCAYVDGPVEYPGNGVIGTGGFVNAPNYINVYSGISGPKSFGTGSGATAARSSGEFVEVYGAAPEFYISQDYVSGNHIANSASFENTTLANFGHIGSYVYIYGNDPSDTFTVNIGLSTTAVPEPASLCLLGTAILGVGFIQRRGGKKVYQTKTNECFSWHA